MTVVNEKGVAKMKAYMIDRVDVIDNREIDSMLVIAKDEDSAMKQALRCNWHDKRNLNDSILYDLNRESIKIGDLSLRIYEVKLPKDGIVCLNTKEGLKTWNDYRGI